MVFACWSCCSVQYLFLCESVIVCPCVRVCCRWLCPCLCLCSAFAVQRLMSVWVWELSVTSLIVGTEKVLVPLSCAQRRTVVCFEWTLAKECGVHPAAGPLHTRLIARCPNLWVCFPLGGRDRDYWNRWPRIKSERRSDTHVPQGWRVLRCMFSEDAHTVQPSERQALQTIIGVECNETVGVNKNSALH